MLYYTKLYCVITITNTSTSINTDTNININTNAHTILYYTKYTILVLVILYYTETDVKPKQYSIVQYSVI